VLAAGAASAACSAGAGFARAVASHDEDWFGGFRKTKKVVWSSCCLFGRLSDGGTCELNWVKCMQRREKVRTIHDQGRNTKIKGRQE